MTSDTRDLQSTEQRPNPPDSVQLSAVQVAASTLASLSAAVVASLFGVTGTVIGAGIVAVISTTGSAIYSASMKRTSNQLRRAREQLLTARSADGRPARGGASSGDTAVLQQTRAGGRGSDVNRDRTIDLTDGADTRRQALAVAESDTEQPASWWRRGWLTIGSRRGLKWPALVGAVALVFALTIGAITAFEAIAQKPISSLAGHSSSASTTVGSLGGGSGKATPTPTPTATSSSDGSGATTPTPSAAPNDSGDSQGRSERSAAPSTPRPRPSASVQPSSAAPQNQDSGDSGSGSSSGGGTGSGGTGSGGSEGSPIVP